MANITDIKKIQPIQKPSKKVSEEKQENIKKEKPHTISWNTSEYPYYPKSPDWYWALGILTLGLAIIGIIQRNILFIILVLLGGFSVALYAARKPKNVKVTISGVGIQIDDRLYPYDALQSFWIFYRPGGQKELSVRSNGLLAPQIKISLGDTDPTEIRALMIDYLQEEKQEESLLETLARVLGF